MAGKAAIAQGHPATGQGQTSEVSGNEEAKGTRSFRTSPPGLDFLARRLAAPVRRYRSLARPFYRQIANAGIQIVQMDTTSVAIPITCTQSIPAISGTVRRVALRRLSQSNKRPDPKCGRVGRSCASQGIGFWRASFKPESFPLNLDHPFR